MIKNIIFDLDGTLADSEELIINSFQHIYLKFHGTTKSEEYIKSSFGAILKDVIKSEFSEDTELVINEYRKYHYDNFDKYMRLFEGAEDIIKYLYDNNFSLGIVTSRLGPTAMKILDMYDLRKYFTSIVTADMCKNHKPDPEPLLMCLKELDGNIEESIFIGDTSFDVECAKNTGVISVLVNWDNKNPKVFKWNPDYTINNFNQIKKLL